MSDLTIEELRGYVIALKEKLKSDKHLLEIYEELLEEREKFV